MLIEKVAEKNAKIVEEHVEQMEPFRILAFGNSSKNFVPQYKTPLWPKKIKLETLSHRKKGLKTSTLKNTSQDSRIGI